MMALSTTSVGGLFMTTLFAYSASVQLDDVDWYFWLPLYSSACLLSFVHTVTAKRYPIWALSTMLFGLLLFFKVGLEAVEMGALFSMDLQERVVREKQGSLLVVLAMGLWLQGMLSCRGSYIRLQPLGTWVFIALSIGLSAVYVFHP